MNKVKSVLIFFALILSLFAGSVVAAGGDNSKPQQTVEQQVYKKIMGLTRYSVFDYISFDVKGDTVVLSGKVYSFGTKSDAASAVKDVPGIAHVVNNIDQLPSSPFDNQIRQSLLRSFTNGGLSRYLSEIRPDMRLIVENGRVTLKGYVSSQADSDRANVYANGVSGVFEVRNDLIVGKRES